MGAGASAVGTQTEEDVASWNTGEPAAEIVKKLQEFFTTNKEEREKWGAAKKEDPVGALDLLAAQMFANIDEGSNLFGKFADAAAFGAALNGVKDTEPVKAATRDLMRAMAVIKAKDMFNFTSGLPDCCSSNPDNYKVVAELPGKRLVEMTLPAGSADDPHDHPSHSMFFIKGGKLTLQDFDEKGEKKGDPHDAEVPSGAAPIFPAGAHQVTNSGDEEVKVLFVEEEISCQPCGDVDGPTPFEVAPDCYKILAENDNWITGMLTMEVGAVDGFHKHKDHLIYVLEGDGVTLYPEEKGKDGVSPPIKPGDAIPAPISKEAMGGLFGAHVMENTGTIPLKMVFFEMKK